MAHTAPLLSGARGWATVVALTTVLSGVVAVQLPSANADEPVVPAAATAPVAAVETARRIPAAVRPVAVAAKPVAAKPAPAKAVAVKPAVKPAAAKPAAKAPVRAAAVRPAAPGLCSGTGWQARRGAAALASLRAGAARTGFSVSFAPARKGYMGLTHLNERRIEVFVRSCEVQTTELLRHVMAHELGHAWDTTRMTAATRAAYLAARGIPASTPWYGCSGCTDFATPAGDFAEVYAQWARGASTNKSLIAGDASRAQLQSLAGRFFGA